MSAPIVSCFPDCSFLLCCAYQVTGPKMLDHEGKEVPGNRGYKYFGAARDLPGVRELFVAEAPSAKRKTRGELMKSVDADYYGCVCGTFLLFLLFFPAAFRILHLLCFLLHGYGCVCGTALVVCGTCTWHASCFAGLHCCVHTGRVSCGKTLFGNIVFNDGVCF
jgi:hypothetical protein